MRVLVVEDSHTLADALVDGLNDEGMSVDVAYDGVQAALKIDLNRYDVVVLDRDLPGLHGDTICRMITERENPALVLMLTASSTPAERVSGLSLGATTTCQNPSTSQNSFSASVLSPVVGQRPRPGSSDLPGSNSTRYVTGPPATDYDSTSQRKSSRYSKYSCAAATPSSAPRIFSPKFGARRSIRSATSSKSL